MLVQEPDNAIERAALAIKCEADIEAALPLDAGVRRPSAGAGVNLAAVACGRH